MESHEFTFNAFAPKKAKMQLKQINANEYPRFLHRVYLDAGKKLQDRYTIGHNCDFGSGWVGSHIFFYLVNNGESTWTCQIIFEKLEGLRLAKPFKISENSVKLVIPPKSNAVAWAKRTGEGMVAIKWNFNHEWD